jgi:hypothetical protein
VRARGSIVVGLVLVLHFGCGRRSGSEIGPAPEKSITRAAPAPSPSSSYAPLVDGLVGYAGEDVSLDGELIVAKHEHIDEKIPGKIPFCMSLDSRGEVMVYFASVPTCPRVRVAGRAFVLRGLTPITHAAYAEVALDASTWACR